MIFRRTAIILMLSWPISLFAQKSLERTIVWQKPVVEAVSGKGNVKFLMADGLVNNPENGYLPELLISEPIGNTVSKVKVEIISVTWVDMVGEEAAGFEGAANVPNKFEPKANISIERKKHNAVARIIPFVRENGKLRKIKSIAIRMVPSEYKSKSGFVPQFANSSVLSSGTWFKIGVTQDGVYKISRELLQQIGIDPANVNPKNIRVYGNGGGMVPNANNAFRYDDLQENAVLVTGENDGSFDANDYVLFYGQGPNRWYPNMNDQVCTGDFYHVVHDFSDVNYYFITADKGPGKRIQNQTDAVGTPTHFVSSFNDYVYHEKDETNLIKSGKEFYGELFDLNLAYDFSFSFPNLVSSIPIHLRSRYISRSVQNSSPTFKFSANGTVVQTEATLSVSGTYTDYYAKSNIGCTTFPLNSDNLAVRVSYSKGSNPEAQGWLDYFELNVRRNLIQSGNQMQFRDKQSLGLNNIAQFSLQGGSGNTIWDVTNPIDIKKVQYQSNGSDAVFTINADILHEFVSFNGNEFFTPSVVGSVANQNLHGTSQVDMVIVSPPDWISEAERLADFHRTNIENPLSVQVVTPSQIYNEFSSGTRDISAIRDYVRMYYDRGVAATRSIRYICLFGDGSYDNKDRLPNNTAFIPTYQSQESLSPVSSYVCDDYYTLLDSNEGNFFATIDVMDIGVGRLPVKNITEARAAVDKIIGYSIPPPDVIDDPNNCCAGPNSSVLSPDWRNIVSFIADDEDANLHMIQSTNLSNFIDTLYPWINIDKIFLDAYQQVSTPGGQRYPDVNKAINNRCEKGALLINYTGHGGEIGLAHERVWMVDDILSLKNKNALPCFVTATCEFSRWDDPSRTSAGEDVFLNPDGGGIALFTTSRLVYSSPNFTLNQNFLKVVFDTIEGKLPPMGEVMRYAKSPNLQNGINVNSRNFSLLGDPAQRLAYPKNLVKTLKMNNVSVDVIPDTISALALVTVSGNVTDRSGSLLSNYSGTLYPTVYDKYSTINTLTNDGGSPWPFKLQKNILYKGKVSITNGNWKFQFVVPKDIAYNYGFGRISFYANNGITDATGFYENFYIGGSNPNAPSDVSGPLVKLYMNNDKFVFGGVTNEDPLILAFVSDSNGVNTVGNGIGHDITAILDQNTSNQIVLNDYYQADLNSYKSGNIRYNLTSLPEGLHTLSLKVWDVYNNSSDAYTEFVVAKNASVALKHVLNYPNPFNNKTSFMFEHNQTCLSLDVHIQVLTVSGKVVKNIFQTVSAQGFRIDSDVITWDGRDDYGSTIGRGVYIYKINVRNPEGSSASQFERLVVLN